MADISAPLHIVPLAFLCHTMTKLLARCKTRIIFGSAREIDMETFTCADGSTRCRKCQLHPDVCTCRQDHPVRQITKLFDGEGGGLGYTRHEANFIDEPQPYACND